MAQRTAIEAVLPEGLTAKLAGVPYCAESALAAKPESLSFEDAAAVPMGGLTALQALRDQGELAAGEWVLINGASGGVGHFAVQIAKIVGARITAVASGRNQELLRDLGAERTIDYETQNADRCDHTDEAVCLFPFPNDHFTTADPTTDTGRRLALNPLSPGMHRREAEILELLPPTVAALPKRCPERRIKAR